MNTVTQYAEIRLLLLKENGELMTFVKELQLEAISVDDSSTVA
jgi:hypothetical protein